MHFLNGGRLYVIPETLNTGIEQQLDDCLVQIRQNSGANRVYRLNFFVDVNACSYLKLTGIVEEKVAASFPYAVINNVIAQPPVSFLLIVEVYYYDEARWDRELLTNEGSSGFVFKKPGASVLIGKVQSNVNNSCHSNATTAFKAMEDLLTSAGFTFSTVIRQWNYIENILGYDDGKQRYQEFNNVRAEFYNGAFSENGYPAATGIGIQQGGVVIEFIAVSAGDSESMPIDNPEQIAAHGYSSAVLAGGIQQNKSTPKFERARYFKLFGRKQLFISGTAAIRGEDTVGVGNAEIQTHISIENIQRLYSGEAISTITGDLSRPSYGHARVYIKNRSDYPEVKKTFEKHYGKLPVVYLIADICRDDLLVEIEGKVILE